MPASNGASHALNRSLQKQLIERQDELAKHYAKARKKLRRKVVHDLRVSARRLIAGIELLEPLEAPIDCSRTRKQLKRLLHSLGDLRDVQVERKRICESKSEKKRTGYLIRELGARRRALEESACQGVKSYPLKRVEREIRGLAHYLDRSGAFNERFEDELHSLARRHLSDRFEEVLRAIGALPRRAPSAAEIHEVRIRFKHFRYAWELLAPSFIKSARKQEELGTKMKDFQTLLGDIQDLHVLLATLAELDGNGNGAQPGLRAFARELSKEHSEIVSRFTRQGPALLAPIRACIQRV